MTEIVGSTSAAPVTPAVPQETSSTADGIRVASGAVPGKALVVQPSSASDLRHNAGWLTVWHAAQDGTRALGWLARGAFGIVGAVFGGAGWLAVKLPKGMSALASLALDAGKFIAVGLAFWIVFQAVREPARVIDPIAVTPELAGKVRDGRQLTAVIVETLASYDYLVRQVWADKESRALDKPPQIPEFQLPGVQISLRQIVDAIRTSFGASDRRVTGQLVLAPRLPLTKCSDGSDRRRLVLRIGAESDGFVFEESAFVCLNEPDAVETAAAKLLAAASAALLRATNPCGAAAYYYSQWQARDAQGRPIDPQLDTALRMIEVCISKVTETETATAYHLKGLILQARAGAIVGRIPGDEGGRQAQGMLWQALDSFDRAKGAFQASLWNRVANYLGHSDFLPTLQVHRGDVLLDIGPDREKVRKGGSDPDFIINVLSAYEDARDANDRQLYAWLGLARALHNETRRDPDAAFERRADYLVASLCATMTGLQKRPDAAALYHQRGVVLDDYMRLRWPNGGLDGNGRIAAAWSSGPLPAYTARHCRQGNGFLVEMNREATREEAAQMHERAAAFEPRNPEYALAWADVLGLRAATSLGGLDLVRAIDAYRGARANADARHEDPFHAWDGEGTMQLLAERPTDARDVWREAAKMFRGQAENRDRALAASRYFQARSALLVPDLNLAEALLTEARRLDRELGEAEKLLACVRELQAQAGTTPTLVAGTGGAGQPSANDRLRRQCGVGVPDA